MIGGDGSGRTDNDPGIAAVAAELREAAARDFEQNGQPAMADVPKRVTRAQRKAAVRAQGKGAKGGGKK